MQSNVASTTSHPEPDIRRFRRIGNLRSLAYLVADYAVVIGVAVAAERIGGLWAKALAIIFIAGRQIALTNLLHSASHGSLFTTRRLNDGSDLLLGFPLLESVRRYRGSHGDHHRQFSTGDPDRFEYLHGVLQLDRRGFWGRTWIVFIRPLLGYESVTALRDTLLSLAANPRFAAKTLLYWLVVALVAWRIGYLPQVLFYWFVPLFTVYPIFYVWAEVSDHFGTPGETRNQRGLFYALFFKGHEPYHSIHHEYPFLPFYRLKDVYRVLVARNATPPAVSGPRSFFASVYAGLG